MLLAIIIIAAVVITDQLTKYLALTLLAPIRSFPLIEGIFELHFVKNRGAAWGMLADNRWVFMTVSVIAIIVMLVYLIISKDRTPLFTLSLSLILGGGIGNMIDRLFYEDGAVVDFLYFKLIDFPVFNIADCAVSVGAALLIYYLIYFETIKPHLQNKKAKECNNEKNSLQ